MLIRASAYSRLCLLGAGSVDVNKRQAVLLLVLIELYMLIDGSALIEPIDGSAN